jgi:MerR family transcriptional regulator, copper efflux regulator
MRIGELAGRLGIATSKIRFLEARGLIHPTRRPSGYRDYDDSTLEMLQIILQAQSLGFTLDEISVSLTETRGGRLRCDYLIKRLTAKLHELDRHIALTAALRERVVELIGELGTRHAENQRRGRRQTAPVSSQADERPHPAR